MSAIKNLFRNGGGESIDRQLDHGYGVMIVTCLIEADSPSKAAVQQASKLGFRMRKTLSDKSLTASCVAREIVEGNINYIRYICDSLSGGTSCNVTLSYGYGATTNVMVRYDEASETDDCFVGRLLLLVELPENEMTSVVPPQDSLYDQIQACSSFPPEVYISPSTKIWDASFLFTNVQQNDSQGKTIHVKINAGGNIYSVESMHGKAQLANHLSAHATDIPPAPEETNEKETVSAPAGNKDAESTTDSVAPKRKASEKGNAKESSKKPRVVTATKEPRTAAKLVDISTPKKSKKTGATSKSTPAAAVKKGKGEASDKSPRKQRGSKPAEPSPVQETECGQDSSEEDVAVEKPTKSKTTSKSKKSKNNDTKGKDVQNQKQADDKGETEEDTDEKETAKKTSKAKSSKKKDPNAPKRPLSAYMLFCQDHREDIVKRNPGKSFGEIGMMLGAKYKALALKDKAPYLAEAEKLRNQHKIDKKEYDDTHVAEDEVSEELTGQKEVQSPQPNKKKKKKKSKKDPNAPKGVMTAYMLFCSAKREQILKSNPGMSVPDTGKVLGKMWRNITAKEKEKFIKLAAKDKERYEDEMKAYKGVESV